MSIVINKTIKWKFAIPYDSPNLENINDYIDEYIYIHSNNFRFCGILNKIESVKIKDKLSDEKIIMQQLTISLESISLIKKDDMDLLQHFSFPDANDEFDGDDFIIKTHSGE